MKEKRVYIVCSESETWESATNEEFITRAEEDGTVWSLKGFQEAWNNASFSVPDADYSYMRIIDVEI